MKSVIIFCIALLGAGTLLAQVPEAFNYQGVARDVNGVALPNQNISLQMGFFHDQVTGAPRYQERHFTSTNALGIYTLRLGEGLVVIGAWDSIRWAEETVVLEIEADMNGGNNYTPIGVSEFASVPYALVAGTTASSRDGDTSAVNELQILSLLGDTLHISAGNFVLLPPGTVNTDDQNLTLMADSLLIENGTGVDLNQYLDNTDAQTLSLAGQQLSISNGNTVALPDQVNDADADPQNELQVLTQNGSIVTLSQNGGAFSINDADSDPFNELQSLSKSGNTVTLSNNGGTFTDAVNDADADPINELQSLGLSGDSLQISLGNKVDLSPFRDNTDAQTLSVSGGNLTISNGNTVILTDRVEDADADSLNELQLLSISNDTVYISQGNFIVLPPPTVDRDSQDLDLNGNILSITNGGSVDLSGLATGNGFWNRSGSSLYPDTGDRVGLGTTSPVTKLHAVESSSSPMAAVFGDGHNSNGPTFGQLGIQGQSNHNGVGALDISGDEIGVLGVAVINTGGSKSDNYGVMGLSDGFAGRFEHDDNGSAKNKVLLSGNDFGVYSDGRVGIFDQTPEADLHIRQSTSANGIAGTGGIILEEADGTKWTIWSGGDDVNFALDGSLKAYIDQNGQYQVFSDRRLKRDIEPLQVSIGDLKALEPVTYHYKDQKGDSPLIFGFIAQDVQRIFPEAVTPKGNYLTINYAYFGVIAIKAIQEQQTIIESQSARIDDLERRLAALEARQ